ncbi:Uncharacterised protein [Streptococcus pneumoniae]|nr:Uncharacterised protein [Streptococcus pneumoniae]
MVAVALASSSLLVPTKADGKTLPVSLSALLASVSVVPGILYGLTVGQ